MKVRLLPEAQRGFTLKNRDNDFLRVRFPPEAQKEKSSVIAGSYLNMRELELRPDLTKRELYTYFKDALSPDARSSDLSCMSLARLIVDQLGGPTQARIFWIENEAHVELGGHAYVIPITAEDSEMPYNSYFPHRTTVGYSSRKTEWSDLIGIIPSHNNTSKHPYKVLE